jgi:hypothetical protein
MIHHQHNVRHGRRRGSVVTLVAVCLIPVLGVTALVLDLGVLRDDRRRAVVAADAAALAGAVDLFTHYYQNAGTDPSGTAVKSAKTTAAANGFVNDGVQTTVTATTWPNNYQGGPFAGTQIPKGNIEVIIRSTQQRYFSSIWSSDNLTVTARAVARGKFYPAAPGILVLDPTDNNTLDLTAAGNVTVTNGGAIDVNSQSPNGGATLTSTGNAVADVINLSDGVYNRSNSGNLIGQVNYNVPPTPDPLAALPEPPVQPYPPTPPSLQGLNYSTSQGVNYSGSAQLDLYHGYYEGISITGSGSVVLHPNPDGSPGIYYIGSHGFSVTSSGGVSGSNILLYSAGTGNISLTASGSVNITPPTSGTYQGISVFQERSSNKQISITAQGNMNIAGTFYAASAKVSITAQGNLTNNIGSQWIAWQLAVTGSGSMTVNYNGQATPIRDIQLLQ